MSEKAVSASERVVVEPGRVAIPELDAWVERHGGEQKPDAPIYCRGYLVGGLHAPDGVDGKKDCPYCGKRVRVTATGGLWAHKPKRGASDSDS